MQAELAKKGLKGVAIMVLADKVDEVCGHIEDQTDYEAISSEAQESSGLFESVLMQVDCKASQGVVA